MLNLIAPADSTYPDHPSPLLSIPIIVIILIIYFIWLRSHTGKKQNSGVDLKTNEENLQITNLVLEKMALEKTPYELETKIVMGSMGSGMSDPLPFIIELLKGLYKTNFFDYLNSRNCQDCEIRWIYEEYRKTLSEHDQEADAGCICDMISEIKKKMEERTIE